MSLKQTAANLGMYKSYRKFHYPKQGDGTLDEYELREHCVLDAGSQRLQPTYSLGKLDILPPEILTDVCSQLDLQSLTDLRRVNKHAMQIVDSIPQYQVILREAPDALRAMLSIGSASFSTLEDLYTTLCTAFCETCNHFGGYLYLITCRRVCFRCLSQQTSFLPLSRADVVRKFGLRSGDIAKIPRIRSRPGHYSERAIPCRKSFILFDHDVARSTAIAIHGEVKSMEEFATNAALRRVSAFKRRKQRSPEMMTKSRRPRLQDARDGKSENRYRFMAIVPLPYFDPRSRSAERGFYCIGCRHEIGYNKDPHLDWRTKYCDDSFVDHMKQWGRIENGFHLQSTSRNRPF